MNDEGIRDRDLLEQYTQEGSHQAFAEIVQRYVNLVYSTCLRELHDHHLAEDATQAVFIILSRKARSLRREVVLAGWLFQTARLVVRNAKKQEARRKERERRAAEMMPPRSLPELTYDRHSPLINAGLDRLGAKDRDAIVLYYYQRKTFAQVGGAMGVSEDAARMRVNRAVEKLRDFIGSKGPKMAIGAVATLLAVNWAQAAPPSCAPAVVAAVCGTAGKVAVASAAATALSNATMKAMLMAKLKVAAAVVATTAILSTAGAATYHYATIRPENHRTIAAAPSLTREEPIAVDVTPARAPVVVASAVPATVPSSAPPTSPAPAPSPVAKPTTPPQPVPQSQPPQQLAALPQANVPAAVKPNATPLDHIQFKVDGGRLTVAAPPGPIDGKPQRVVLRRTPGETSITRTATSLNIENQLLAAEGAEIRTRIVYQPGNSLSIQRTLKGRGDREYAIVFRQNHRTEGSHTEGPAKAWGQATLQVSSDGGESWNHWTADDFPHFSENYPLAYFAYLAPIFRDCSSRNLCIVPASVAKQVLTEGPAPQQRQALADLLRRDDPDGKALGRREIERLYRDTTFLADCLESDELEIRKLAQQRISEIVGKPVAFDANETPEKRKAALRVLRNNLSAKKTKT